MKHTARRPPVTCLRHPADLWENARSKARKDGVAMRTLILTLLEDWLAPKKAEAEEEAGGA